MTFSEFANLLNPILNAGENTAEFVITLFTNITKFDNDEDYNSYIYKLLVPTLKSYYNGTRGISKLSKNITKFLEKEKFVTYLNTFNDETISLLCDKLINYCPDITPYNAHIMCAELFMDIIQESKESKATKTTKILPSVSPVMTIEQEDILLLSEANNICPICRDALIRKVKGKTSPKYTIIKIFPENLSKAKSREFSGTLPPSANLNSIDNKLALCRDCAEEYNQEPFVDEYVKLSEVKRLLQLNYDLQLSVNSFNLEKEISHVLNNLFTLNDSSNVINLPLEALKIDKKILPENFILKNQIKYEVLNYYSFVENLSSHLERNNDCSFDIIGSQINLCFKALERSNLSQDEIIQQLSSWILSKANLGIEYSNASHIIISFFIQNCEVFREIS